MRHLLILASVICCLFATPANADGVFHTSGQPIQGEAGHEYPDFFPDVSAYFGFSYDDATKTSGEMTLLLVYNDSSTGMQSIGQALSGFTWSMGSFSGNLSAVSAVVASGSTLVGQNLADWIAAGGTTDVSGYWRFADDVNGGQTADGTPIGNYGVGAAGDINGGVDSFGTPDIIDSSKTFAKSAYHSGNGDFMIIPDELVLNASTWPWPDGFKKIGPMVQDSLLITFDFSGDMLTSDMIQNGVFLFGTEGQPVVPEPGTWALFGLALGAGWFIRRRRSA